MCRFENETSRVVSKTKRHFPEKGGFSFRLPSVQIKTAALYQTMEIYPGTARFLNRSGLFEDHLGSKKERRFFEHQNIFVVLFIFHKFSHMNPILFNDLMSATTCNKNELKTLYYVKVVKKNKNCTQCKKSKKIWIFGLKKSFLLEYFTIFNANHSNEYARKYVLSKH